MFFRLQIYKILFKYYACPLLFPHKKTPSFRRRFKALNLLETKVFLRKCRGIIGRVIIRLGQYFRFHKIGTIGSIDRLQKFIGH